MTPMRPDAHGFLMWAVFIATTALGVLYFARTAQALWHLLA